MKKYLFFIFIISIVFIFKSEYVYALQPDTDEVYQGIDVSVYQGSIDFESVREDGINVVYIRAGEGFNITDSYYRINAANATAAGLQFGFYYYVTATTEEQAVLQATRFAGLISGISYTARPAMDFESFGGLSTEEINSVGAAFISKLNELTGVLPMLYTDAFNASNLWEPQFGRYPLWVADYNGLSSPPDNPVWDGYAGFQYSDRGNINGINGNVDLDRFTSTVLITDAESPAVPSQEPDDISYIVMPGDTLWSISRRFGVSISSVVTANNLSNPNLIFPGQILIIPSEGDVYFRNYFDYTVRAGDTLWGISRRFSTTISEIQDLNDIDDINLIFVGEILRIPVLNTESSSNGLIYTIQFGDTLSEIAERFGVTVSEIADENQIQNPNLIYAGETLYISQ